MTTLAFDIETDGLLDQLTKIHCIVTYDLDSKTYHRYNGQRNGQGSIEEGLQALERADIIVGHNVIDFDVPAIRKLYPWFNPKKVFDTVVAARLIWTDIQKIDESLRIWIPPTVRHPYSLEAFGYRLKEFKGEHGKTEDWQKWSQEMEDYCEQDVRVTEKLYRRILQEEYSEQALDIEHKFATIIQKQVAHGWSFDEARAEKLYVELASKRQEITDTLIKTVPPKVETMKTPQWFSWGKHKAPTKKLLSAALRKADVRPRPNPKTFEAGPPKQKEIPFNPGSRDQIADYLKSQGWKPKAFTDSGKPKVDETTLKGLSLPNIELFQEYLLLNKRIGQLAEGDAACLKLVKDGRIHGRVITNGAVTGRCTHSGPNVAQTPANHAPYGEEFRACYRSSPGYRMVGWDASGLELRCLAHYMHPYDGGDYARKIVESDIHTENQKAAELESRDQSKTFIYSLIFGGGDKKVGSIVGGNAKRGKELKEKFFEAVPAYKQLKDLVDLKVKKTGFLRGLDGRILKIRSPHAALNTLLQSAGAVLMKQALILMHDGLTIKGERLKFGEDYAFVGNIHDEIQAEVKPEWAELFGKAGPEALKIAGKKLGFRCPLDGEYKIGDNWSETH